MSVTAKDKGGALSTAVTQTITVANVAPTVRLNGPTTGNEGSAVNLTAVATDPSSADTAKGFTYSWTVKSGTTVVKSGTTAAISFTPPDNGSFVVSVTAKDKDGGVSPAVSQTILVANVPPTAKLTGPTTGKEGTAVSLTATATDPSTADTTKGFTYAWTVALNNATFASGTGTAIKFTPTDNGNYVVSVTAKDKDGGVSPAVSQTIAVANVAPTAKLTGPTTGKEGTAISLTATATDPSTVDTKAGFTFSWTVTKKNGSVFTTGTGTPFTFTPNDNDTYTVKLTAKDKDGGVSPIVSQTIIVANVAPTASLTGPTTGTVNTAVNLTATATDPSSVDTAAGFTYTWTVKKGTTTIKSGTGAAISFTPTTTGSYIVSVTAKDKDGGLSAAVTKTVTITAASQAVPSPRTLSSRAELVALSRRSYIGRRLGLGTC